MKESQAISEDAKLDSVDEYIIMENNIVTGDIGLQQMSHAIIGAAIDVHKILGPGLLEKYYRMALAYELRRRGFKAEEEVSMPFVYKDLVIANACRADIVVNDQIVLELKAREQYSGLYASQLLSYLKLSGLKLGLVFNFNQLKLKDGIERVVNGFIDP